MSSPSKRTHLLESLSPLTFKLAKFRVILTHLLSVDDGPEILGGEDANGLFQGAGAEFSGNSAISGHSSDIQRVLHL